MELAVIIVLKILGMMLILAIGVLCSRLRIISNSTNRQLTELVLLVVNPVLILMSYNVPFDKAILRSLLWTIAASALVFAVTIFISRLFYPDGRSEHARVERCALVYTNCGFMGIPLIHGVLGTEGVLLMSGFIAVFNILVWTHGVMEMSGSGLSVREFLNSLKAPGLIAVLLGLLLFLSPFRLPVWLAEPLDMISGMNTPLAMIVAGVNLAQGEFLRVLRQRRTQVFNVVKLLLVPLLALALLKLLTHFWTVDYKVAMTVFVGAACPTASMVVMFADRYGEDQYYAADLFMASTLFSLLTIPLMAIVANFLLA